MCIRDRYIGTGWYVVSPFSGNLMSDVDLAMLSPFDVGKRASKGQHAVTRPYGSASHGNGMDGEGTVITRQKHTPSEIATKLAVADEMAAQGRLHGDIARSLGISVMTYHRWRKARGSAHSRPKSVTSTTPTDNLREEMSQIRLENLRLRRLVTDLLLEKDRLEEGLRAGIGDRRTVHSQLDGSVLRNRE